MQTAKARATQFLLSLKIGAGEYKVQETKTPANEAVKFYVNPDKKRGKSRKKLSQRRSRKFLRNFVLNKPLFITTKSNPK